MTGNSKEKKRVKKEIEVEKAGVKEQKEKHGSIENKHRLSNWLGEEMNKRKKGYERSYVKIKTQV